MKIGIQQTSLGENELTRCFSTARICGIDGLGLCYNSISQAEELALPQHLMLINSLRNSFKVTPTSIYLGCLQNFESMIGSKERIESSTKIISRAIIAALRIKCDTVIIPFMEKNKIEMTDEMFRASDALSEIAELAEDSRITLAIVTSLNADQIETLLGNVGSDYVKICFDVGITVACRFDANCMLRRLGNSRISQVFLKDVWCNPGMPPEFNVRLGRGDAPLSRIIQSLKAIGYDDWVVLDTPPGDRKSTIVTANIEFTKNLLEDNKS